MYQIYNIYVLAAVGTIGGGLFGFDISSMSAWIGTPQYKSYFGNPDADLQGGITASMSAGSWAGSFLAGWLSDNLGRRKALGIACMLWIIGSIITLSSHSVAQLIAGRVINGLCVGITSSQTPVYLAELAPKNIRGRIVGFQQWSIEWGILIMYLISYGCSFIDRPDGPAGFRLAWGLQAIPAVVLLGFLPFFPESPRWLASKDRWEDCLQTLGNLHGHGDTSMPVVQAEYEEVREAQAISAASKDLSWAGLIAPNMWRRTTVAVFTQVWQQLLGGNIMMYYVVYVFQMAGLEGDVNLTSSIIQYVIFLVTTIVTIAFIDRIGRRPLFIYGGILMSLIHFTVAGLMADRGHYVAPGSIEGNDSIAWQVKGPPAKGIIACTYLFVAIYGLTWAPAAWIYISELFPLKYRAKGVGLATSGNWAFNFALAYFVPPAFKNIQWKTYVMFGIFCMASVVHAFFMFPETAGKTLEEVDDMFEQNIPAWKSASFESKLDRRVRDLESKGGAENLPTKAVDEKKVEAATVEHHA